MFYVIKREFDTPFDNSQAAFTIKNEVYDVVKSQKNTGLDSVSDFIIDDNNTLVKSDPRLETTVREELERVLNLKLHELLLG